MKDLRNAQTSEKMREPDEEEKVHEVQRKDSLVDSISDSFVSI
jgi:DNA replicative helicase MCM subunit Mcm2 (Cdc46/Mcm family)